jgi:hypothetical protein
MNLFLDIDGVLLGKTDPASPKIVLANHAREFLEFAVGHFDCYWLTSHCKGDAQAVLDYLRPYVPDDLMPLLRQVKPTTFDVMKTEALKGNFYWLDDSPMACEIEWLKDRGLLDRWICVDTRKGPDDLLMAMERLGQALASRQHV